MPVSRFLIPAGLLVLSACSSQQLYGAGQSMQRNECNKLTDMQERQRCMAAASLPQDRYERESEAARKPAPAP